MRLLGALCITAVLSACVDRPDAVEASQDAEPHPADGRCNPYRDFETIKADHPQLIVGPSEVRHATGELAYLRGLQLNPGQLSTRFAITVDCRQLPLDLAEAEYLAAHRERWGRVVIESAWTIVHEGLYSEQPYFAFLEPGSDDATVLQGVARIATSATLRDTPRILFFTATAADAIRISRLHGVNGVVLEWSTPIGKGALSSPDEP